MSSSEGSTYADIARQIDELMLGPAPRRGLLRRLLGRPAVPLEYVNSQVGALLKMLLQHGARLQSIEMRLRAIEGAIADANERPRG